MKHTMKKVLLFSMLLLLLVLPTEIFIVGDTTTTISFEPERIVVPFIENLPLSIVVKLKVENVHDLKTIVLTLSYDKRVLELVGCSMDPIFYAKTGGWRGWCSGDNINADIAKSFTGSSDMFILSFKINGIGNTTISLQDSELLDSTGNKIQYSIQEAIVEVVPFETYVDGEYLKLKEELDLLSKNYSLLQNQCMTLNLSYTTVLKNYSDALEKLKSYETELNQLKENYTAIKNELNEQTREYNELKSSYDSLSQRLSFYTMLIILLTIIALLSILLSLYLLKKLHETKKQLSKS